MHKNCAAIPSLLIVEFTALSVKIADEEIEIAKSVYLIAKITEMSTKIMSKTAGASGAPLSMDETAESLCEIGREFYRRGWVFGTSGNFSAKISHSPLRLAITSSGLDKGALTPEGLLEIDGDATVLRGSGYPSAETSLHLVIVGQLGAGAVLHTHSIWSTLLSDRWAAEGGLDPRRLRNAQRAVRRLDP